MKPNKNDTSARDRCSKETIKNKLCISTKKKRRSSNKSEIRSETTTEPQNHIEAEILDDIIKCDKDENFENKDILEKANTHCNGRRIFVDLTQAIGIRPDESENTILDEEDIDVFEDIESSQPETLNRSEKTTDHTLDLQSFNEDTISNKQPETTKRRIGDKTLSFKKCDLILEEVGEDIQTTTLESVRSVPNNELNTDRSNHRSTSRKSTDIVWQTSPSKLSSHSYNTFPNRPNSSLTPRLTQSLTNLPKRPQSSNPARSDRPLTRGKSFPTFSNQSRSGIYSARSSSRQISSAMTSYTSRSSNESSKKGYSVKLTKKDLDQCLPRKSFFSCHDKALKEAGQDTDDPHGIKARKKRLMEILQKRKDDNDPSKPKVTVRFDAFEEETNEKDRIVSFEDQTAVKLLSRKFSKSSKKKSEYDEEEIRVDYQPLLIFLKYISEHPDEYMVRRRAVAGEQLVNIRPRDSLVKLGNIFQRGQHGSSSSSVLLNAVHDIRPRFCDPGLWTKTNSEKVLLNLAMGKKESKPDTPAQANADKQEEPKTEYELKKYKMEEWLKTVSAAQLNKAKELALSELGEEDSALSKWWISLKTCNYIRQQSGSSGLDRVCV